MDPSQSFTCSVCDDELTSVSTLHYHQMCLHTAEELSLAILVLRELPVNASSAENEGVAAGSVPSPSTDCEDNLLRNGLAKYPRFLNANGVRKSKTLNSESNDRNVEVGAGTPKNQVGDKENIVQNVDKNSNVSCNDKGAVGCNKVESVTTCEGMETNNNVKSRLWGAIKTLDGKTVDAPIVRIDKRRTSLKSNKAICVNTENDILPESNAVTCDGNETVITSRKTSASLDTSEGYVMECHAKCEKNPQNKLLSKDFDEDKVDDQDSCSILRKEKILENHLKLMNMSSFDDVIELDCSEESEDDGGEFLATKSHSEENDMESEELEIDAHNCLLSVKDRPSSEDDPKLPQKRKVPDRIKNIKNRRHWGKVQKHRSWFKGNHLNAAYHLQGQQKCSSNDSKKAYDGKSLGSEVVVKSDAIPDKIKISGSLLGSPKVLVDSSVQTDEMRKNNENGLHRKETLSKRDTPKKKFAKSNKFNKEPSSLKHRKVVKTMKDMVGGDGRVISGGVEGVRIKPEVIYVDGERRYSCEECPKTYKKRSHLERHRRVHTGERPFVCQYCEKGFSVRSILNQHIRIHTGEKPYSCTICSARFPQKSGLMTHMMLHTGKPFKCDQCYKAFVSNHKLVNHMKSHVGDRPHICTECKSSFFTVAALNDHQLMHSRSRKHICNKCNASFVHEVYLKIHLATHLLEAERESLIGTGVADSPNLSTTSQSNGSPEENRELYSEENRELYSEENRELYSEENREIYPEEKRGLTLTLDALDKFCNGETIMMDMSV